jgi:hypothetical protein
MGIPGDMSCMTCTRHTWPRGKGGSEDSSGAESIGAELGVSGGGSGEAAHPVANNQPREATAQGPINNDVKIQEIERADRTSAL